jgi:hypothetical protein
MPATSFTITQEESVTLQFSDAAGNTTTLPTGAAAPTYTLINPTTGLPQDNGVITLTPASDGLSAEVAVVALGTQRVAVNASGVPTAFFDVNITAGLPASISFVFGAPEAQ